MVLLRWASSARSGRHPLAAWPPDGEFTHVMVRLRTPELDIVDTLIAAGIANNRAEAIR